MKYVFIAYDQDHNESIIYVLTRINCRGFTAFGNVAGRGSETGEPHFGTHAWPSLAQALITVVEDRQLDPLLAKLKELDERKPLLGLRAFVWNVEKTI